MIAKNQLQRLKDTAVALGPKAQIGLRLSLAKKSEAEGDLWLFIWPDESFGIQAVVHGSEGSGSILHIFQGVAHEEIYSMRHTNKVGGNLRSVLKVPSFPTQGSTITTPSHYIHSLAGAKGSGSLVTLNGFFPPLRRMEFFQEEGDKEGLSLLNLGYMEVDDSVTFIDLSSVLQTD